MATVKQTPAEREAQRQMDLRKQIVCQLQSLGEPLTTAELIHELTSLRHSGAVDLPPINETNVYAALEDLVCDGKVDESPSGVWHYVCKSMPTQRELFE